MTTFGIIVATSRNWVIGMDGKLPWDYPADLARFKAVTQGTTVIMGYNTWASLPMRPLPGRRNFVLTRTHAEDVWGEGAEAFGAIEDAMVGVTTPRAWFIGGEQVYQDALKVVDCVDLTVVPEVVRPRRSTACVARFPVLDPLEWYIGPWLAHKDPRLVRCVATRMGPASYLQKVCWSQTR